MHENPQKGNTALSRNLHRLTLIGGLVPDDFLKLDPPWLNLRFSLSLTICESWALFFVSSWCVNLIRVFLHDDTLQLLDGLHAS